MKRTLAVLVLTAASMAGASLPATAATPDPISNHGDTDGQGNFIGPVYGQPTLCSHWHFGRVSRNHLCHRV